jgi:NodT family efflux transporter outer membrane factor (OMF) lipoprotein
MRPAISTSLLPLLLALAACSPGPDYVRPTIETPSTFKEAGEWKLAASGEVPAEEKWWLAFDDPTLTELEAKVEIDNQNLKAAEAQYRAARAAADSARAAFLPSLSLSAGRSRGANTSGQPVATGYSLSAALNWEIDVWGRIRRSVEAADARSTASEADLAAARLSAQALLAQDYIQLRATERQLALLQRTVDAYQRFLDLTRNRLAAGVASPLDVAQAETQLGSAQVQASEAENQRAQFEHAIAVLVGAVPAAFSLGENAQLPTLPATPQLLPSTLLEHRPDIAAAERRAAAASAGIGVADAAYFPVLDLAGSIGFRSGTLANLVSLPNRVWSLGPTLAMTLFDGGARSAAVLQASAGYDQAVATYRQTVLTAFQEVEDNLTAARLLEGESEIQERTLAAARRSREIAENQYRAGINGALNVITAQATELSAEVNAIAIASRRLQARVQLLKNTGGFQAGGQNERNR